MPLLLLLPLLRTGFRGAVSNAAWAWPCAAIRHRGVKLYCKMVGKSNEQAATRLLTRRSSSSASSSSSSAFRMMPVTSSFILQAPVKDGRKKEDEGEGEEKEEEEEEEEQEEPNPAWMVGW